MYRHQAGRTAGLKPAPLLLVLLNVAASVITFAAVNGASSLSRAPVKRAINGSQNAASPFPATGRSPRVKIAELKSLRSSSSRHGSLLDRRVGNLIFENGSDHGTSSGISPLLRAQTHTACTPPSNSLTVSAETFWTLVCSFDHSTNSGSV